MELFNRKLYLMYGILLMSFQHYLAASMGGIENDVSLPAKIEKDIEQDEEKVGEPIEDVEYKSELDEAIATGTYEPDNDSGKDDLDAFIEDLKKSEDKPGNPLDSGNKDEGGDWLPANETIAEEVAIINDRNHVSNVIDGDILEDSASNEDKRNAVANRNRLWPNKTVFYYLHNMNAKGQAAIREAMIEISRKSCISFKELKKQGPEHHIKIFHGPGCFSYVGKYVPRGQKSQPLSIGYGCEHKGIVIHELMHAMGFYHEQSRYDRDQYVEIKWENIKKGRENNFAKKKISVATGLGLPYDYDGIMHYGKTAFSKNGQPTIVRLKNPNGPLGQRNGLSSTDAAQLNILYSCKNNPQTKPPVTSPMGIIDKICGTRSTQLQHPLMDTNPQHIVGGQQARPGDWPWQVGMIRSRTSRFIYCGGTLINNEWVISAAHCFRRSQDPSSTYVILGEHNKTTNEGTEQVISLAKIIIHEKYNPRTIDNDIALLKLSRPVQFTKYIRPACIPDSKFIAPVGKNAFVSGWGTTSQGGSVSIVLQVASVPIVSRAACKAAYRNSITKSMICAGYSKGGTDSCQGDSGGPLVTLNAQDGKYYLTGVVSWGVGCAKPGKYGVYAKVSYLRSWIDKNLPKIVKTTKKPVTTPIPSRPPIPTDLTSQISCDFDNHTCAWYGNYTYSTNWNRVKTILSTKDHTTEKGFFMAVTPVLGAKKTSAALSTASLKSDGTSKCIEVFYKILGPSSKSLVMNINTGTERRLAHVSKSKGNLWEVISVDLELSSGQEFTISMIGSIDGNQIGDMIAIDDVLLIDGLCRSKQTLPSPALLTCAFEVDICHWQQSSDDNFNWTRRKGRTPSSRTGPSSSSTGLTDYYVYIETSYPRKRGDIATLKSPSVASNSPFCLSFQANMYGSSIGTLKLSKLTASSKQPETLYEKSANQGTKWFEVNVDLPAKETFQILISGIRGRSYRGDIAIDEIRVYPHRCRSSN